MASDKGCAKTAAIVTIIGGLIAIFIFVTGKANIPELLGTPADDRSRTEVTPTRPLEQTTEPTSVPTGRLTDTPLPEPSPTNTTIPSPTALPDTSPNTILEVGQLWREEGLELVVAQAKVRTDFGPGPGVILSLRLVNQRGQDLVLRYSIENFSALDNRGSRLKVGKVNTFYGYYYEYVGRSVGTLEIVLRSGSTVNLANSAISDSTYEIEEMFVQADIGDPSVTEIIFQVSGISSIDNARWRIPIYH